VSAPADWETVLAEVEADVARTEDLLHTVRATDGTLRLDPLSPAETMLPTSQVRPSPFLPDPATMPRVPEEMLVRIQALRSRLDEVGRELVSALEDVSVFLTAPATPEMTVFPARPAPPPRLIDRAL
jgi:hypothetical protein